eukprot:1659996-Lingulodinium_polyedra.AAC.1
MVGVPSAGRGRCVPGAFRCAFQESWVGRVLRARATGVWPAFARLGGAIVVALLCVVWGFG